MSRIDEIRERASMATPGPWRWHGNTDNHSASLENPHWVVLSTIGVERTASDRDVRGAFEFVCDGADYDELTDEQLTELGVDLDDSDAVYEMQEYAALARAIDLHLQEDEFGNLAVDDRLAFRDEHGLLQPLDSTVVYEVCPEATSRDDRRVYRADWKRTRSPDAEFIAHARADIDFLLAEVDRLSDYSGYVKGWDDAMAAVENRAERMRIPVEARDHLLDQKRPGVGHV